MTLATQPAEAGSEANRVNGRCGRRGLFRPRPTVDHAVSSNHQRPKRRNRRRRRCYHFSTDDDGCENGDESRHHHGHPGRARVAALCAHHTREESAKSRETQGTSRTRRPWRHGRARGPHAGCHQPTMETRTAIDSHFFFIWMLLLVAPVMVL